MSNKNAVHNSYDKSYSNLRFIAVYVLDSVISYINNILNENLSYLHMKFCLIRNKIAEM